MKNMNWHEKCDRCGNVLEEQAKAGRPETKNKNQDRLLKRTELQALLEDLGVAEFSPGEEWEDKNPRITIKVYSSRLYPRMFQALEMIYDPDQIQLSIAEPHIKCDYFIDIKNPILNPSKNMNTDYEPEPNDPRDELYKMIEILREKVEDIDREAYKKSERRSHE